MAMIEVYTSDGLSISRVQVKLDEVTANNDLVVRSDGLYVSGDYNDGSGNIRLKESQINYVIATDMSPWEEAYNGDNSTFKNHVACDCVTHRCWTAEWDSDNDEDRKPIMISGKTDTDKFRKEIDWVLPGDFFRIKNGDQWDYYIITEVAPGEGQDICSGCGQVKYPFNGHCEHGNPNYYYNSEDNEFYTLNPPMENPENYDAPKICSVCGQPILIPSTSITDNLIGYPGNDVVSYAFLGTAGDV